MENKKLDWKKIVLKLLISVAVVAVLLGAFYLIARELGYTKFTKDKMQEMILKTGIWGPLVYILISFLQVTFIPVPFTVTILAGCYLFPIWKVFLFSYIGALIGSMFAFFLGRKIGKPFVNWVIGDKETVDVYLAKMKGKENVVIFFMFLFPFFPDDAICALSGILPISYLGFFIMQLITRCTSIWGNILFLGGTLIPYTWWGIMIIAILSLCAIAIFIVSFIKADIINEKFYNLMDKINNLFKRKKGNL